MRRIVTSAAVAAAAFLLMTTATVGAQAADPVGTSKRQHPAQAVRRDAGFHHPAKRILGWRYGSERRVIHARRAGRYGYGGYGRRGYPYYYGYYGSYYWQY